MTVTVVCDVLGEENNGTSVASYNLIRYLKKQGHTVRVLCADQSKSGEENFFVVPNRSFGKFIDSIVRRVGVSLAKPDKEVIERALNGCDHVHVMMPLFLGTAAVEIARERDISITAGFHMQAEKFTAHIKLSKVGFVNNLVYRYIYKRVYRYADGIHYPTEFIKDVFESRIGVSTDGYVISNGVNSCVKRRKTEKPEEFKDKIVILSTGRYSGEKSQDTLIKAVKRSKHRDAIQLIFAGQGTKEKQYKRLSKSLPVKPVFKLFERSEINNVLNYCDLYVHPAVAELEGIACLESIACGKLTIVSDSEKSATKNFAIDGKCIFRRRSAKDLARVIDYWIDRPTERAEYEEKYFNSAVAFDSDECMRKMEEMIKTANAGHSFKYSAFRAEAEAYAENAHTVAYSFRE